LLVFEILKIRFEKFNKEEIKDKEKQKEYNNAKKDYEEFTKEFEESASQKLYDLNEEEINLLKISYRKASKLCHPDLVSDELKEKAETMFRELHLAYQENNLNKVLEILEMLEKGNFFVSKSEKITEIILLKTEIERLKIKLSGIKNEIAKLQNSETYQTLKLISNWDEYFKENKERLTKELDILKNE
jgi:hypothetical protein